MTPQRSSTNAPALPALPTQTSTTDEHSQPANILADTTPEDPRQAHGHGNRPESKQHDTTGQPPIQPHRHQSDTMAGQHQRQEAAYLCQEITNMLTTVNKERSTKLSGDGDSLRSSYGQSPADELQEFGSGSGGRSIFCHLTSGSSQFHGFSGF